MSKKFSLTLKGICTVKRIQLLDGKIIFTVNIEEVHSSIEVLLIDDYPSGNTEID